MSTPDFEVALTELLAMRARIDRAIEALGGHAPANETRAPEPTAENMKLEDYAARRNVSIGTVMKWRRLGMPCVVRGRIVRVPVAEADRWDYDIAMASLSARGGRR